METSSNPPQEVEIEGNEPDEDEEERYCDPPEGCVRLRPSIAAPHIPPTIFVEYPLELKSKRRDASSIELLGERRMGYKSHWERTCIRNGFIRAGFKKSSKYWTALWSKHQNESQLEELNCLQKVNHFPASWCVGRKDRLSRTLGGMKRMHGDGLFDFHPETFIMPGDMDSFLRLLKTDIHGQSESRSMKNDGFWIMKPVASSCGRGISVVTSTQALELLSSSSSKKKAAAAKSMLFQRYLSNPLLINKKKFDLRIYVLVTGVDPLRVYIHREGLTRISTSNFSLKNIKNRFAHLTNYSVNKKNAIFKAATYQAPSATGEDVDVNQEDEDGGEEAEDAPTNPSTSSKSTTEQDPDVEGYKWSLEAFKQWLSRQYSPQIMNETFRKIYDIILKTMVAMEGEVTPSIQRSGVNYRTNCFELFGCDVILDEDLQPHLLEVNVSPSLMGSSPLDRRVKGALIADVLHTVGFYPYDPALLKKYDDRGADEGIAPSTASSRSAQPRRRGSVSDATSTAGSAQGDSGKTPQQQTSNPFAFSNLSRLMHSQETYRRQPCSASVDLDALAASQSTQSNSSTSNSGSDSTWWQILLLVEDEMHRARTGGFIQVHPLLPAPQSRPTQSARLPPESPSGTGGGLSIAASPVPQPGEYYLGLYRNARFHDHLLYKWLSLGGCKGQAGQRYLPKHIYQAIRANLSAESEVYQQLTNIAQASFPSFRPSSSSASSRPRSASAVSSAKRRPSQGSAAIADALALDSDSHSRGSAGLSLRRPSTGGVLSSARRRSASSSADVDVQSQGSAQAQLQIQPPGERPSARLRARTRSYLLADRPITDMLALDDSLSPQSSPVTRTSASEASSPTPAGRSMAMQERPASASQNVRSGRGIAESGSPTQSARSPVAQQMPLPVMLGPDGTPALSFQHQRTTQVVDILRQRRLSRHMERLSQLWTSTVELTEANSNNTALPPAARQLLQQRSNDAQQMLHMQRPGMQLLRKLAAEHHSSVGDNILRQRPLQPSRQQPQYF